MKNCIHCGVEKPLSEYYKHPMMSDGHLGACKECHRDRMRRNRWKKVDAKRAYDIRRYRDDPERKARANADAIARRKAYPAMARAHRHVAYHKRVGNITQESCEVCGREDTHAHHDDYRRALDVHWLCPPCHSARHALLDAKGHDYHREG
jgi:hypothetical protein